MLLEPNRCYTLRDLDDLLKAHKSGARSFLNRYHPEKMARDGWLGSQLLDAVARYDAAKITARAVRPLLPTGRTRIMQLEPELIPMPTK